MPQLTRKFWRIRLEVVALAPAVPLHNDLEKCRRFRGLLTLNDALDMVRHCLSTIKDRFGPVCGWHDLEEDRHFRALVIMEDLTWI